jgi:alpha-1,6-mannosyltransferase
VTRLTDLAPHRDRSRSVRSQCTQSEDGAAFKKLVVVGAAIAALVGATPFAQRAGGDYGFLILAVMTGPLTYAATVLADRTKDRKVLIFILGLAVVLRLYALTFHPFLSTDVYRYVWDGTVQAAGINPYRYVPADPALAQLRTAGIYPDINRADYAVTIYPPVAEFFFFVATRFGANTVVMRFAMLGCEALSVFMMLLMLRRMGKPLTRIVAYAWHPLAIWEIANSGHIDALMVALTLVGIWAAIVERPQSGALAITLASLAKPLVAPALAVIWRPWDWKTPVIVVAVVALCYLPYLSVGWGVLGFLPHGYLNEEGLVSGSGFWLLSLWRLAFGSSRYDVPCYVAFAAALLLYLALRAAFRPTRTAATILADANVLLLVILLLLSPEFPWYYLIMVPFAALLGSAPTWAASIGALLLTGETTFAAPNAYSMLIVKSLLFGSVLACWAFGVWSGRWKQALMVQ